MYENSRPSSGWDSTSLNPTPFLDDQMQFFNYDEPAPGEPRISTGIIDTHVGISKRGNIELSQKSAVTTAELSRHGKVAIPRATNTASLVSSGRVSQACEGCREQKAKCSGHRPMCHRCLDTNVVCVYSGRKKEKMARKIDHLTSQIRTYERLLSSVHPLVDDNPSVRNKSTAGEASIAHPSYSDIPQDVGNIDMLELSFGPIAYTNEDFNRNENQATGYLGQPSEIWWLYSLKCHLQKQGEKQAASDRSDCPSIVSVNYSLDELEIPSFRTTGQPDWPSRAVADRLVESYFKMTHASFPFIGKILFLNQYRSFYSNPNSRPGKRWMAVLNMVFAIASLYSCLLEDRSGGNGLEHAEYFSRAWQLSMGSFSLLDCPNLQQVQVEGLSSLYLLSVGHVNRAFKICQIAINSAVTMGINLRNESIGISQVSRERRYRLWWALYLLDTKLRVMTGRPSSIRENSCTVPLPVPYEEEDFWRGPVMQIIGDHEERKRVITSILSPGSEIRPEATQCDISTTEDSWQDEQASPSLLYEVSPSGSLYLLYAVGLATIVRNAVDVLYSPGAAVASWVEVETTITGFNRMIEGWLSRLPAEYHFLMTQGNQPFVRQRTALAFRFYSSKLIILEPCLRRTCQIHCDNLSSIRSCTMDAMAALCIHEAGRMIDILPAVPDKTWLYETCPWWCILHYIMQSGTVLLVGLLGGIYLGTNEASATEQKIKKACRWLKEMATSDLHSQRAWTIYRNTIFTHAPQLVFEVEDPEI